MSTYFEELRNECENQLVEFTPLNPDATPITLDAHQREAMLEIGIALENDQRAFSVVHSCGSGKTILAANLLTASQKAKHKMGREGKKDLILSTERSLMHSIRKELQHLGIDVGIWGDGKRDLEHPVILASIQSLQASSRKTLEEVLSPNDIDLIIGDEADKYLTKKRKAIVQSFSNAIRVGLTATPKWPDGRDISEIWGRKVHRMSLREGILSGVNVPPLFYLYEVEIDEHELKVFKDDYIRKVLSGAMKAAEIEKSIPHIYSTLIPKEQRKNYPTLVFVPSVNLVRSVTATLQESLTGEGLRIAGWTGTETSSRQMEQDIHDFNHGSLDILVLCEMAGRGLNLPRARCIIDAYPTLSANKLEQRHGRVLRRIREDSKLARQGVKKPFSLIAQVVPRSNRFRPYLLPDLLDCWDDFREQRVLVGRQKGEKPPESDEKGRAVEEEIRQLKEHIQNSQLNKPKVALMRRIDVYKQLQLREHLPNADRDGFFTIIDSETGKEERYGTLFAWSKVIGTSRPAILRRIQDVKRITGKGAHGHIYRDGFYPETEVMKKCQDLMQDLPRADDKGFFTTYNPDTQKMERYGSVKSWARAMKISAKSIRTLLGERKGRIGKDSLGRIVENAYYPESVIMSLPVIRRKKSDRSKKKTAQQRNRTLKETLVRRHQESPHENEQGFILLTNPETGQEERYGHRSFWMKEYSLSRTTIYRRLRRRKGVSGITQEGRLKSYFPESLIRELCVDLIQELPQADESGLFRYRNPKSGQEERFGTAASWAKALNISRKTTTRLLNDVPTIKGKDISGRIRDGYIPESSVRKLCGDYLSDVPQANSEGFFSQENPLTGKQERYAGLKTWAHALNLSEKAVIRLMEEEIGITAMDQGGRLHKNSYFAESVMRRVCSQELADTPQADETGFFILKDPKTGAEERYGTSSAWYEELGKNRRDIFKRIKEKQGITGRDNRGVLHDGAFYSWQKIVELYPEFYGPQLPEADENGFFAAIHPETLQEEKYGIIYTWEQTLGLSHCTIKKRLHDTPGRTGKTVSGTTVIGGFYAETDVRKACEELLKERPIINEDGFFWFEDPKTGHKERYGNTAAWVKIAGRQKKKIYKMIKDLPNVNGKTSGGKIIPCYPESKVMELFSKILPDQYPQPHNPQNKSHQERRPG